MLLSSSEILLGCKLSLLFELLEFEQSFNLTPLLLIQRWLITFKIMKISNKNINSPISELLSTYFETLDPELDLLSSSKSGMEKL